MAFQFATAIRNEWLNVIESIVGPSPILEVRSGAPPTDVTAADTGLLLASMVLPVDWLQSAAAGTAAKLGIWEDASINANGDPGHFRVWNAARTTCFWQGTASSEAAGTGDLLVDVVPLAQGTPFTISTVTLTALNA